GGSGGGGAAGGRGGVELRGAGAVGGAAAAGGGGLGAAAAERGVYRLPGGDAGGGASELPADAPKPGGGVDRHVLRGRNVEARSWRRPTLVPLNPCARSLSLGVEPVDPASGVARAAGDGVRSPLSWVPRPIRSGMGQAAPRAVQPRRRERRLARHPPLARPATGAGDDAARRGDAN